MNRLPQWAQKPKHPKKVIATSRGWEVAHTGEVLTSVRGLDEKLAELFQETDTLRAEVEQPQKEEEVKATEGVEEPATSDETPDETKPEEPVKPRKRRGRPPKKKPEDTE